MFFVVVVFVVFCLLVGFFLTFRVFGSCFRTLAVMLVSDHYLFSLYQAAFFL